MAGQLEEGRVWIRDQAEANRVYNKGRFGQPRSGGSLELDLVEAAYLVEEGRLKVAVPSEHGSFYAEAAAAHPDFEARYFVYREFRERGETVRVGRGATSGPGVHFELLARGEAKRPRVRAYVRALSERSPATWAELWSFATACREAGVEGLVGIADEEAEVTVYDVGAEEPAGAVPVGAAVDAEGQFLVERVVLTDAGAAHALHTREFFGRAVSKRLHLSLVEAIYLAQARGLRVVDARSGKALGPTQMIRLAKKIEPDLEARLRVFTDLKDRGLIPKTGYKFGTHFRAYAGPPEGSHAPLLVHVVRPQDPFEWPTLSRAVRLAHGVRKTLLLAAAEPSPVRYVRLRRASARGQD